MQNARRDFVKKSAMVVGAGVAVGATTLAASGRTEASSNGVIVGHSPKKEVLYKKTNAWEEFYKQAK